MAQKKFQDLNLKDAFLFAAAMEDEETCRITLQVLLNRKITKVRVRAEHTMLYSSDYRSIRLDVYARDEEGFICTFDPFGQGLYQYTFENRCIETGNALGDGTTKIFLSTKGKNAEAVPQALVHFLQYIENSSEQCVEALQDETVGRLHNRVRALKKSREWESRYMRFDELLQDAERVGLNRGMEKGIEKG